MKNETLQKNKQYEMTVYYDDNRVRRILANHIGITKKSFENHVTALKADSDKKILYFTWKGKEFEQFTTYDICKLVEMYLK